MKPLKLAGIGLGVIFLLIAAIVAYVAATFDGERVKSDLAKIVLEKKQRTLKIDGDIALSFWPSVGVQLGKVSLSERGSEMQFAAIDSARVSVAVLPLLSKKVVVKTLELTGTRAIVIKRKDGTLNIADLLSKDEEDSSPVQADIAGIKISNAQLTWQDEQSGRTSTISGLDLGTGHVEVDTGRQAYQVEAVHLAARGKTGSDDFEVKLEAPRLAYAPGKARGERIMLSASLKGASHAVTATLTATGIDGNGEALNIGKLALDANARSGNTSATIKLDTSAAAQLDKQIVALDKIAGQLEIADPQMPMKSVKLPLSGHLRAELAKPSAAGALSTRFDESKIALKFDVSKFSPLALAFDLDIDQLDVDKYLPPSGSGEGKKSGEEGRIDLSVLKGLNLKGEVRIGKLQVANVKASNVRLDIRAADGKLDVAPHSMNLYDGSMTGALSVNANGNAVTLRENLAGISVNPLMKDLAGKDLIEGRGNVQFDVRTHGETVTAMKKSLDGTASVALRDGALKGINLAQTFRELKSKFSAREDAVQQAKATDKTDFSELTASFRIANGVAHNDDLSAKSPFLRLGGSGDIDIGNGRLDYLARASVVATSGGQGAKDLEHLKGVTVPVRATGPFDRLSYKLEIAGLAEEAVKAKVEEKKQEFKQQAKEKLLKNLLK
jgi:AsmA protein